MNYNKKKQNMQEKIFRLPEKICAFSFFVVRGLPRRDLSRLAMTVVFSGCLKCKKKKKKKDRPVQAVNITKGK